MDTSPRLQIDRMIRSTILAAGGLSRDLPILGKSMLRRVMEIDPSLSEDEAVRLMDEYRDLADKTRFNVEIEDYIGLRVPHSGTIS